MKCTIDDFAEELVKDMFFNALIWGLCRLGRTLVNWSKPCFIESMGMLELAFHYYAMKFQC